MTTTRTLLDAILAGEASQVQDTFQDLLASRISPYLDYAKRDLAQNMFTTNKEEANEETRLLHGKRIVHNQGRSVGTFFRNPQDQEERDKTAAIAKKYKSKLTKPGDTVRTKDGSVQRVKEETINETLPASASIKDYIDDFLNSNHPSLANKSPEKRRQMAIAAFYAAKGRKSSASESVEEYEYDTNNFESFPNIM